MVAAAAAFAAQLIYMFKDLGVLGSWYCRFIAEHFLPTQVRSRSEAVRLTAHGLGSASGPRSKSARTSAGNAGRRRNIRTLVNRCLGLPVALVALVAGCTYGPVEERAVIAQVLRLGDSYRAIAVIQHDVFRRPRGLSAFPDGGRWRYLERRGIEYLIDSESLDVRELASQDVPDDLWESFDVHIAGLDGDSVAYLRLTGCPRGGECYPGLQKQRVLRLSTAGGVQPTPGLPQGIGLPGVMAARRPGERSYVRFGIAGDTITARFDETGSAQGLFRIEASGSAVVIGEQEGGWVPGSGG